MTALAGCDLDTLAFRVPAKIYRFNTAHLLWVAQAQIPDSMCAAPEQCCEPLAKLAKECDAVTLTCESQRCGMTITIEKPVPVTLAREVPDLALLGEGSLAKLRVTRMDVRWEEPPPSALGVEVELLMAPVITRPNQTATRERLATVSIPPPSTKRAPTVTFAPKAAALFGSYARKASDTFWLIAIARVPMKSGDPIPTGEFALAIEMDLSTSLGL